MYGQKRITKEILEVAREKGMTVSDTARFYGVHRKTVDKACEEHGIMLPYSKFSPQKVSVRKPIPTKPKRKPDWSASPAAIARALKNKERIYG